MDTMEATTPSTSAAEQSPIPLSNRFQTLATGTPEGPQTSANGTKTVMSPDLALHHAALVRMIQCKGQWSAELQQELEIIGTQIRAEQLAQEASELATLHAADTILPDVAPGVSAEEF